MKFDRWTYDPQRNRFVNRPVVAATGTIADDIWIRLLQAAVMAMLVRRIEARWREAFDNLQRRIEGGE